MYTERRERMANLAGRERGERRMGGREGKERGQLSSSFGEEKSEAAKG